MESHAERAYGIRQRRDGIKTEGIRRIQPAADAMRGRAAMPYNAKGVDSIPPPSVLNKKELNRKIDLALFW